MLAAASSFFSRSNISQNYTFGPSSISSTSFSSATSSRSGTPVPGSSGSSASLPAVAHAPPFQVGLWKVQSAAHKTTGKRVSVWTFEKRGAEMERMSPSAKEKTMEVLKNEASSLSRLRHPCILEVVEPLEETRSEFIFATEPLLSSLYLSIPGASHHSPLVDLDEVEIQKGILQLCKGLAFLHTSARIIHSNITPESILINNAGDWKLGGLGLTIPLKRPDGSPTSWEFPTFDSRMSPYTQRSFDYIAPEYALDEVLTTASDMYSLGCLTYAVHSKGDPPFKNFGNLGSIRENAGKPVPRMDRLDRDLQSMLSTLITRQPHSRPSPESLPTHAFFSSLPISTLNFLDRSTFAAKTREEKVQFMKGLANVLERFSEGLRIRKILPSLLEEMKDPHLLPSLLPNIFIISRILSPPQFASLVLPSLKPLFAIKEPPQNMLTLLDNLGTLQEKTEKLVFREHVLPLVYNALESEHAVVQEKALKAVPDLCETIDYAEVQGVLFPRVAMVFTKTRILSVKVATLHTFLSMVKTLDQTSLTQKLVPLLSKIRTKEPAVTMGTLQVQEAMGMKVDREAVATLVLPQLWVMAMGPLLNVDQFQRFMGVIKKLGDRVEKEHNQYLRDSQRHEDRSAMTMNGTSSPGLNQPVDFESLVGGASASGATVKSDTTGTAGGTDWSDDVWGSILASPADGSNNPTSPSPFTGNISFSSPFPSPKPASTPQPPAIPSPPQRTNSISLSPSNLNPSSTRSFSTSSMTPSRMGKGPLGAKPIPSSSFNTTVFPAPPMSSSTQQAASPRPVNMGMGMMQPLQPTNTGSSLSSASGMAVGGSKPNYSISLADVASTPNGPPRPSFNSAMSTPSIQPTQTSSGPNYDLSGSFSTASSGMNGMSMGGVMSPSSPMMGIQGAGALFPDARGMGLSSPPLGAPKAPSMGMGDLLTPSKPAQPAWGGGAGKNGQLSKSDWGDFDPLA